MNYYIIQAAQTKKPEEISIIKGLQRIENINHFKKLRGACKVWKEENLEWDYGKEYKLHSPYSNTLITKSIHENTNFNILAGFINDGNVYN